MTVYRILVRHELIAPAKRRRGRRDYKRWQRERPMELWQMDIVGGALLPDGVEAKVVTWWTTIPGSRWRRRWSAAPPAAPCAPP
jgi:hypothetical protein